MSSLTLFVFYPLVLTFKKEITRHLIRDFSACLPNYRQQEIFYSPAKLQTAGLSFIVGEGDGKLFFLFFTNHMIKLIGLVVSGGKYIVWTLQHKTKI